MSNLLTEKDFKEYLKKSDFGENLELISEEKTEIMKQSIYTFKLSQLKYNYSVIFTVYMTSQFNSNEENNLEYKTFKDNEEIGFNGIHRCLRFSQTLSMMREIKKAVESLAEDCHKIMSRIN